MTFGGQVRMVARAEAQVEVRGGEVFWVAAPFGLAALLVLAMAVGADLPQLRQLGAGLYWTVLLLLGALVTLRAGSTEPPARRDALLLAGLDPGARFIGRWVVAAGTMTAFGLVLWPALVALYDVDGAAALTVLGMLPVFAAGMGALGTLAADLTTGSGPRGLLASLLVVPVGVPLTIAGTQAADGLAYGASPLPWVVLALFVDATVLVGGLVAAPVLAPAPRTTIASTEGG